MRTLALIAFACGASSESVSAQISATIESGVSVVRYDGFLSSAAGALTPTLRWEDPHGRGFLSAHGTYLRFESGRRSLDGTASGSWFSSLGGRWRGELGFSAGASDYSSIASFSHGALEGRLHLMHRNRGAWLGATVGRASFGDGARPVTVLALGTWLLRHDVTMFASLDRSFIGDTAYSDVHSSAWWQRNGLLLQGTVGARFLSRGGGRGVYGEGTATWTLGRRTALLLSAGRYPTDAVSGSIAGRYVTAALRLGVVSAPKRVRPDIGVRNHSGSGSDDPTPADAVRLELRVYSADDVLLTVHAPAANGVEISGDFTDWRPVALTRASIDGDAWVGRFPMSRGMHRINVKRDGGRWMAPAGTTRSNDDFDGEVGVFLVP